MTPQDRADNVFMKYRVFLLETVVTGEGDLIIAGTPGTLLHWGQDGEKDDDPVVMVQWDHYLYFDDVAVISYDRPPRKQGEALTGRHYNWAVPLKLIRWHAP